MEKIKQETCKERIVGELADRLKEIKKKELTDENILAITKRDVYTIELSWGGPQDYFEVWVQRYPSGNAPEIERIFYHFLDWFDGTEIELQGEQFSIVKDWIEELGLIQ